MSEAAAVRVGPPALVRLPVERPQPAVAFLRARGGGVMDMIAHFWERLPQTPPLARADLHLVAAVAGGDATSREKTGEAVAAEDVLGVMLYVPKAYRADVLAPDPGVAALFAGYIQHVGQPAGPGSTPTSVPQVSIPPGVTDLSGTKPVAAAANGNGGNGRCAIDFVTGSADGVAAMVPHLLPLVGRKAPARRIVNVVMQLPPEVPATADPSVRPARDADLPALNRWRRLYKEERGILFDADMDAWVDSQRVFVYERPADAGEKAEGAEKPAESAGGRQVVAVAKFDLELSSLVEIGGVYTFPEFRNRGFGHRIMADMAARVRAAGKTPTLQVDESNTVAYELYVKAGWRPMGRLARVWLSNG